jgi:hypothetical protein
MIIKLGWTVLKRRTFWRKIWLRAMIRTIGANECATKKKVLMDGEWLLRARNADTNVWEKE